MVREPAPPATSVPTIIAARSDLSTNNNTIGRVIDEINATAKTVKDQAAQFAFLCETE